MLPPLIGLCGIRRHRIHVTSKYGNDCNGTGSKVFSEYVCHCQLHVGLGSAAEPRLTCSASLPSKADYLFSTEPWEINAGAIKYNISTDSTDGISNAWFTEVDVDVPIDFAWHGADLSKWLWIGSQRDKIDFYDSTYNSTSHHCLTALYLYTSCSLTPPMTKVFVNFLNNPPP